MPSPLVISDSSEGIKAVASKMLKAFWQRCRVNVMRSALRPCSQDATAHGQRGGHRYRLRSRLRRRGADAGLTGEATSPGPGQRKTAWRAVSASRRCRSKNLARPAGFEPTTPWFVALLAPPSHRFIRSWGCPPTDTALSRADLQRPVPKNPPPIA